MDHQDPQVLQGHKVLLVLKELKVLMVHQDLLVLQEYPE